MTIGIVATLKILPEKIEHFEKHFTELSKVVLAEEAGCRFYALHRSRTEPNTYKVLEQYDSAEAFAAHGKYPAFQQANVPLKDCVAEAPVIEVFDGV